jgi:hypothetical protein
MRRLFIEVIVTLGCVFICSSGALAAWAESKHQGASIRHPQGWKVDWGDSVVGVVHPQNQMIWCMIRFIPAEGVSSRQVAEVIMEDAKGRASDIRPVKQLQVSQRPDLYGIKFSGEGNGVPFNSLVLVVTEDGQNYVIRQYSAPTKTYDEMKLTLIPILRSFCYESGGGASGASPSGGKGWQDVQSPGGAWRFTAPAGWRPIAPDQRTDFTVGEVRGPKEQDVTVMMARGDALRQLNVQRMYPNLAYQNPQAYTRMTMVPYLSAADIVQDWVVNYQLSGMQNVQLSELKPLQPDTAQYALSYGTRQGQKVVEEGILHNSSVPHSNGDYNLFTISYVKASADIFQGERNELWRILNSFEASPQFGAPLIQFIAQMKRESLQAAANMALNSLRTTQNIAREHVAIAQQKPGIMAQQGQGWINAVTGQEVVRDPQSGQRWQVPVGGQYIYGSNTGEVIRADRPLQTHELPEGFKQFEAVK